MPELRRMGPKVSNSRLRFSGIELMPTYKIPDVFTVELNELDLPAQVPVDRHLNEKPLSACSKSEVDEALRAFSVLVRHSQTEIESIIEKHIEIRRRIAHLKAYRQNFDSIGWVRRAGPPAG